MKRTLIVLVCLLFVVNSSMAAEKKFLSTKSEIKKLCEDFMQKIVAGEVETAFDIIEPHFHIPEDELSMLKLQTVKQLGLVGPRFGKPIGYEFVKEESIKKTLLKYTFIEKFEEHAVRWIFIFYKPKEKWLLNSFLWDDMIHTLFE